MSTERVRKCPQACRAPHSLQTIAASVSIDEWLVDISGDDASVIESGSAGRGIGARMTEIRFRSTRDAKLTAAFGEALAQGLAPDGGLYVPIEWPRFAAGPWGSLADMGAHLLAPFMAGDPLAPSLSAITSEAFDFPAPLVPLGTGGRLAVLELFHGPTAAFSCR